MIPIPERFIPRVIKQKRWLQIVLGITIVGLLISFAYWQLRQMQLSFIHGPDLYNELDAKIISELLDSTATGLHKYHSDYGHYPQISGKYFIDSIRKYVHIEDVYIYADSINRTRDTLFVKNRGDVGWVKPMKIGDSNSVGDFTMNDFDQHSPVHTYVGVGIPELTIIYRPVAPDSFLLYSVGKDLKDDHGKGDDVVYKKRKRWF